jgi:hypothetical protein
MTDAQREYLLKLIETREITYDGGTASLLRDSWESGWMTVAEASDFIDLLRNAPRKKTPWQITQERRASVCAQVRDFMWGRDGANEATVAERWDSMLSPHFFIQREVWGTHFTGQRLRIDRVLWPKFDWADGTDTPIGFEIKTSAGAKKGRRQAADYGSTVWDIEVPFPWSDAPKHRMLLIGLHSNDREDSRQLEPHGGFSFVFEPGRAVDVDLRLYYNGSLMWSVENGVRPTRWGARRRIGAHA